MGLDYFRYYSAWNASANERRWDAPADPWQLIPVDPDSIEEWTMVSLKWGLGRVTGGDWDTEDRRRLDETSMFEGLRERYVDGTEWEKTAYFQWGQEKLEDTDSFRGCETIEEFVEKRCGGLDELVEDIRENGYQPNYEALYDSPADAEYIHDLEPIAVVGRDGDVLLTEGFHRVILGQLLNVDAIPMYVLQRHEQWQEVRDKVYDHGKVPQDGDIKNGHPDLHDLLVTGDQPAPFGVWRQ